MGLDAVVALDVGVGVVLAVKPFGVGTAACVKLVKRRRERKVRKKRMKRMRFNEEGVL